MEPTPPTEPHERAPAAAPLTCSYCHLSVLPQWYFCPNCGAKLASAPLSTTLGTQLGIYAFSVVLPLICFLLISKWPGAKYARSQDERARTIGVIASALLILSTVLTIWWAYTWTEGVIQSTENSINADLGF